MLNFNSTSERSGEVCDDSIDTMNFIIASSYYTEVMRCIAYFQLTKFIDGDSTVVILDTAHSQLLILDYVNLLRLEWFVLRLTRNNKNDDVPFSCSEVRYVAAHFQMIF